MKRIFINLLVLIIFLFLFLFTFNLYAHSGRTGPSGCHMNYYTAQYHCHNKKVPNYYATYYYIHYQAKVYGPYSSYSSCTNAARGAGLVYYYCSTSKY